jgi:APA family basic amino acid/polyamine antiporter
MSSVMTGLAPYSALNDAAPVVAALQPHPQLMWLKFWVIVGALAGLTSVIITMIIPQARIWLTMSHDGLLPKVFGAVHPRFRTPHISTAITGVLAAAFAGLLPIGILGELVSIGTLIAFIVVCIGVVVLRFTRPDLPRPFKVSALWFVAPGGVVFCSAMAYSLPNATWLRLVIWSVIGFAIYFFYGYAHSRLRGGRPPYVGTSG